MNFIVYNPIGRRQIRIKKIYRCIVLRAQLGMVHQRIKGLLVGLLMVDMYQLLLMVLLLIRYFKIQGERNHLQCKVLRAQLVRISQHMVGLMVVVLMDRMVLDIQAQDRIVLHLQAQDRMVDLSLRMHLNHIALLLLIISLSHHKKKVNFKRSMKISKDLILIEILRHNKVKKVDRQILNKVFLVATAKD